jgi:type IX secretion system PorP/SprF family membrane protein
MNRSLSNLVKYCHSLLLGGTFLFCFSPIFAQQSPQFSIFSANSNLVNPAFSGWESANYLAVQVRDQWSGYTTSNDGSGNLGTTWASGSFGVTPKVGLGFLIYTDKTPSGVSQQSFKLNGAYHLTRGTGNWSFGFSAGTQTKTFDDRSFRLRDPNDPVASLFSGTAASQTIPDVGLGIIYSQRNWAVGISVDHISSPNFSYNGNTALMPLEQVYSLNGNAEFPINDYFDVLPYALLRAYSGNLVPEAGARVYYNKLFYVGAGYRNGDAAMGLIGVSLLNNKLDIGYSLDITISNSLVKKPLSHEIGIRYQIPELIRKEKGAPIRTPRFRIL